MYSWIIYFHVAGALGFMLAHGVSGAVAFALRRERSREKVCALLELSANSYGVSYGSLLVLLVTGVAATFMGNLWGRGWIWTSLILLIGISGAMGALGSRVYGGVRKAVGLPYFEKGKVQPPAEPASADEIEALLAKGNPLLLTAIGFGGTLIILWLMMFKPF